MATTTLPGPRMAPVLGFNFLITFVESSSALMATAGAIHQVALGGFSECSGLEMTMQVEEYKEGGRNGAHLKFPTRVNWSNLILKRGVTTDTTLWEWHYSFVEGRGRRRDGIIVLQDEQRQPVGLWTFKRAFPAKWTGPAFNAAQNAVAVETLELAHEGLTQARLGGAPAAPRSGRVD